jgi:hypothetical protein
VLLAAPSCISYDFDVDVVVDWAVDVDPSGYTCCSSPATKPAAIVCNPVKKYGATV